MAGLGVISTITRHGGNRRGNLGEQFRQHWGIAHAVAGDLNRSNFQRLGINPQMHLAPLAAVVGTVLLGFPFAFAQHLDPSAIDQQMERVISASIGDRHLQMLLASRNRAEIGNLPIQSRQLKQALDQPHTLAQGKSKQAF